MWGFSFWSAALSSRASLSSPAIACRRALAGFHAAISAGVSPSGDRNAVSAPARVRTTRESRRPFLAATMRGVQPPGPRTLILALPHSRILRKRFNCPASASWSAIEAPTTSNSSASAFAWSCPSASVKHSPAQLRASCSDTSLGCTALSSSASWDSRCFHASATGTRTRSPCKVFGRNRFFPKPSTNTQPSGKEMPSTVCPNFTTLPVLPSMSSSLGDRRYLMPLLVECKSELSTMKSSSSSSNNAFVRAWSSAAMQG
mmetsp:Transcript_17472/g.41029  ORF Transcript_17472/g.41029 Transcript_17472/m.41029 type:complete len:259 (+) Transcript_17472:436-1212(+)